jgi:sensor histidine kinase regulating citrate/malate metabolism
MNEEAVNWHAIVESIPDVVITMNQEGRVSSLNQEARKMFPEVSPGASVADILGEDLVAKCRTKDKGVYPIFLDQRPGEVVSFNVGAAGFRTMVLIVRLSGTEELERQMTAAKRKVEFMGPITRHDALNSLTGIFGYLELAETKTKEEAALRYITKAKAVAVLVRRQLEFTRYYQEIGEAPRFISVYDALEDAVHSIDGLKLEVAISDGDVLLYADPILSKAFRGMILFSQRMEAKNLEVIFEKKADVATVELHFDGQPIPAVERTHVFNRAYQRDEGMDLFLAKEILMTTGLKLIEKGENAGMTFVIEAPAGRFR